MDSIGISIGIESLDLESISISIGIEFLTLDSISIVSVSKKLVSKVSDPCRHELHAASARAKVSYC